MKWEMECKKWDRDNAKAAMLIEQAAGTTHQSESQIAASNAVMFWRQLQELHKSTLNLIDDLLNNLTSFQQCLEELV